MFRYENKSEAEIIKDVWEAQNACNIYALINHFPDIMKRLRDLVGFEEARNHIAIQWFADKIADLAGRDLKPRNDREKQLFEETVFNNMEI